MGGCVIVSHIAPDDVRYFHTEENSSLDQMYIEAGRGCCLRVTVPFGRKAKKLPSPRDTGSALGRPRAEWRELPNAVCKTPASALRAAVEIVLKTQQGHSKFLKSGASLI